MDGIQGWAAALCVAAIGCALMQMLAPKDGLGRIFKLMLGAFFLCCMVMPLLQMGSITRPGCRKPAERRDPMNCFKKGWMLSCAGRWKPPLSNLRKRPLKIGTSRRRKLL